MTIKALVHVQLLPALPLQLFRKRGILVVLVLEVASLYRQLSTSAALTHVASNRVCNCLALIQSVATHQASKAFLLDARIPLLLYPLLTLPGSDRASEFVRVTTLGMIGSLVKEDDSQSVFSWWKVSSFLCAFASWGM